MTRFLFFPPETTNLGIAIAPVRVAVCRGGMRSILRHGQARTLGRVPGLTFIMTKVGGKVAESE